MEYIFNDGGRAAAGFKGKAPGGCVCRAIAIATGKPYKEVYDDLNNLIKKYVEIDKWRRLRGRKQSARGGIARNIYEPYLASLGFKWVPTMRIGQGCKVHLTDGELPNGKLIVRLSKHLTAVIDGIVHDTHDPQREVHTVYGDGRPPTISRRCVYGYFIHE